MSLFQLPVILYTNYFPGKPIDESHGLIEKLGIEALINANDWKAVEKKVIQLPSDDITRVMSGIGNQASLSAGVEQFIETESSQSSEFQDVLAGIFYTKRGWDIRSGTWAKEVGDDQWEGFFKYLNIAAERLNRSYDSQKLQLEGVARLIHVFRGASEKEEAIDAFNICKGIDPTHYLAHIAFHRMLTPRWQGSNEEMIEFGESIENDQLRGLIQLSTMMELYSDMSNEDEDEEDIATINRFRKEHSPMIDKVMHSLSIPTGNSMLAIDFKNHLACMYSMLGMKKDRDQYIKEMNGNVTMRPWYHFGVNNARDLKLYQKVGLI